MLFVFITLVLIAIVSNIGYIPIGIGSLAEMHLTPRTTRPFHDHYRRLLWQARWFYFVRHAKKCLQHKLS